MVYTVWVVDKGNCYCYHHPHLLYFWQDICDEIEHLCMSIFLSICVSTYIWMSVHVCLCVYCIYAACIYEILHRPLYSEANRKSCKQTQYNRSIYSQSERKQENTTKSWHIHLLGICMPGGSEYYSTINIKVRIFLYCMKYDIVFVCIREISYLFLSIISLYFLCMYVCISLIFRVLLRFSYFRHKYCQC